MKSSKIEDILNYEPPQDAKTVSPFAYYPPLHSTFDSEFAVPPPQTAPQPSVWGANTPTERPFGGVQPQWKLDTLNPPPPPSFGAPPAFTWGDCERRSLCNSTWRAPAPTAPRPPFSAMEIAQNSLRGMGGAGAYSLFPPGDEAVFKGSESCYQGGSGGLEASFGTGSSFSGIQTYNGTRAYYPFLSPLGRNFTQNLNKSGHTRPMVCNFCKNNKEIPDIYLNHYLYDPETKVLSCPVLRKHVCEICGATGDQAHTLQYCPVNRKKGLQAKVPVLLKTRTITNSTGKIRRN